MVDYVQIGFFAINVGIAFGGGMLWQKVRGHDKSLDLGREKMQSIDGKLDKLLLQFARMNGSS